MKNTLSRALLLSALWAIPAGSQDLMVKAIAEASEKNAQALKTYTWKMRLQPTVEGKIKPSTVYQMRYDSQGELQRTALEANKAETAHDFSANVFETVKSYMAVDSAHLSRFFGHAQKAQDGLLIKLTRGDYLQPGDEVSIWVDVLSRAPKKYAFATKMEGSPLTGAADFARLPDGTSYASVINISLIEHHASFRMENYGFVRQ